MQTVTQRYTAIRSAIPAGVTLVAVSKFHPVEALRAAYDAGARDFGESRVQELAAKVPLMPADVRWHFIGHLQTNKVRQLIPLVDVIQSVDSLRLLRLIDAEALRAGRRPLVLLQAHVAREETKYGFDPDELASIVTPALTAELKAARIAGIMGMASNTDDRERVQADFRRLRELFDTLRAGPMAGNADFTTLSMGMSHDCADALACGTTMVRIGTDIFGEREC